MNCQLLRKPFSRLSAQLGGEPYSFRYQPVFPVHRADHFVHQAATGTVFSQRVNNFADKTTPVRNDRTPG